MPLAMVVGVLLCRPLASLETASANMLTPVLIAAMLFLTFCRIELRDMRLALSAATKRVLGTALGLICMQSPEKI